MSEVYGPSLMSRSFVLESKLSHNGRASNGFASETQTSFEEKTSRFALKNMPVCHHRGDYIVTMDDQWKCFSIVFASASVSASQKLLSAWARSARARSQTLRNEVRTKGVAH